MNNEYERQRLVRVIVLSRKRRETGLIEEEATRLLCPGVRGFSREPQPTHPNIRFEDLWSYS